MQAATVSCNEHLSTAIFQINMLAHKRSLSCSIELSVLFCSKWEAQESYILHEPLAGLHSTCPSTRSEEDTPPPSVKASICLVSRWDFQIASWIKPSCQAAGADGDSQLPARLPLTLPPHSPVDHKRFGHSPSP